MKKKKIAIIGASYLQKPLVQKCKKMDIETHVFAWEKGSVCKDISDFFYPVSIIEKHKILEVCRRINIDGIVSISSDIAMPTVSYVASELALIANDPESTFATTNKYAMRKRLSSHGLPCPEFYRLKGSDVFVPVELDFGKSSFVVKPTDRSGSRGVRKVNGFGELEAAIQRALDESFSKEVIIEEFITGREISVEMISWKGEHFFLAATDKVTTGPPYFVEIEHHQPAELSEKFLDKIKFIVKNALSALGVCYGASHSELIVTQKEEMFIVEIGARMGGDFIGSDLVALSTGYDFVKGVIEVALGKFNFPHKTLDKYAGVYFLCHERSYLTEIFLNDSSEFIVAKEIFDKPLVNLTDSSDRSGYLIYQADRKISFLSGERICEVY